MGRLYGQPRQSGAQRGYPQQAIKQSVATHELGHALGLDHSTSKLSVMYPVDQSRTTLSTADLNALKAIYND
ncbi:matrixin family metalloprotease [Secundilactobacillus similis]|uniref:matrixin family metalloprotease n=1 Tax=Secundilactobacillus similis TaxID=414682 RepID=UPI001CDAA00C